MRPLDSDAPNADAQLHVEFYEHNREPDKGVVFVRIMIPGDKTNIYDQPAREHHKARFPRHWLSYQMQHTDMAVIGTPLLHWHQQRPEEFTAGHLDELTILKFQTVEQLATASDAQLQRVGMGAVGLRERARQYLAATNSKVASAELEKQADEIAMLKAAILRMEAQRVEPPKEPAYSAGAARRGGRRGGWNKGKKKVPVNVNDDNAATHAAGGQ